MTTAGLSCTDKGNTAVIGGIATEYYSEIGKEYGKNTPIYNFEPHIALKIFINYINKYNIKINI